jgi:hypothetical protein
VDEKTTSQKSKKNPEAQKNPEKPNEQKAVEKHSDQYKIKENSMIEWGDTVGKQIALAKSFISSGMLPPRYRTPEQVITAKQFSLEIGLNAPLIALKNIAIIDGTPTIFGDLPLALVRARGNMAKFEEYLFDKEYRKICMENKNVHEAAFGAYCYAEDANGISKESYFTIGQAERAGLLTKNNWKHYRERMLTYRARSMTLKDVFPHILNGVGIGEYDHDALLVNGGVHMTVDENGNQKPAAPHMTPEKIEAIERLNKLIDILQKDYNFNNARILQLTGEYLKTDDVNFASMEDILAFEDGLAQTIDRLTKERIHESEKA